MMQAKRGDNRPLTWTVNADITTADTVLFLARTAPGQDPAISILIPAGDLQLADGSTAVTVRAVTDLLATTRLWALEVEAVQGTTRQTFPSSGYAYLEVVADLT